MKNIIFDLGNVLVNFDFTEFWEKIGAKPAHKRFLEEAEKPILLFEAGKISKEQFFSEFKKIYDFEMPLPKFEKIWSEVFSENLPMVELAKKLHSDFDLYIFSNTDEIHFPYIWKNFPSLHFFGENLMLSYEIGAVKPEKEAYENALKKFNLKPENCVFIDDRPINIKMAQQLGMKGIVHRSFEETAAELSKILKFDRQILND
ncbi:MAG: hypothetical protein B6D62_01215 [Candidatus Cloacimonas sp. 4484_275]|nr:MAG: hypothetical protein B6D62_01215 [Candidatus Cloacimonas sp. 4484_275]